MTSISALCMKFGILIFVYIYFFFFVLVYSARNLKPKKGNGKWMKIPSYFKINECSTGLICIFKKQFMLFLIDFQIF